mmetsp:Transcript_41933/g.121317  ORF Transcript_41933/g.121317 Transcript_41933/m.121317 type:complete len:269 (+) Transcript_41933:158-964(+)
MRQQLRSFLHSLVLVGQVVRACVADEGLPALGERDARRPRCRRHADVRHYPQQLRLGTCAGRRLGTGLPRIRAHGAWRVAVHAPRVPQQQVARPRADEPPARLEGGVARLHRHEVAWQLPTVGPLAHLLVLLVRARNRAQASRLRRGVGEADEALNAHSATLAGNKGILVHVPPRALGSPFRLPRPRAKHAPAIKGDDQVLSLPNGCERLPHPRQQTGLPAKCGLPKAEAAEDAITCRGEPASRLTPSRSIAASDRCSRYGLQEVPQQ